MEPFALLQIGINAYPGSDKLNGCVNDIRTVQGVLTKLNGRLTNYRELLDRNATRARIRAGFRWLEWKNKDKAVWIVQYSGHGTMVRDLDGDEPYGVDGALCPIDYKRNGLLLDDEIGRLAAACPGKLILFFDSCYAGQAQRGPLRMLNRLMRREVPRFVRVKDTPPNTTLTNYDPARLLDANAEKSVLVGTSQPYVTAADAWIEGQWRGAGTHALMLAWSALGVGASYLQVQEAANEWLSTNGYIQRIVLGGREENFKLPFLT